MKKVRKKRENWGSGKFLQPLVWPPVLAYAVWLDVYQRFQGVMVPGEFAMARFGWTRKWIALGLAGLAGSGLIAAEPWGQWRGPRHDGTSTQERIPLKWSPIENLLWKIDLPGPGYSTPAVWGDNIFLTCTEGQELLLLCVGTNGKEKWRDMIGKGNANARVDEGNSASASPCADGKHVWSFVSSGDLHCHTADGKRVWSKNLQKEYGKFNIQFGMHSTPVLHEGKLYLQLLHTGGQWVICLDAATGGQVWKVERPSDGRDECPHSYASPTICPKADNNPEAYLITHGNDYAVGHSLKDGSELWRVTSLNPKEKYNNTLRFVASPVASGGLVVVPTAKNGQVVALKPNSKGIFGPGSPNEVWRKPSNTPDVPSPLVLDGLVYLCRENGTLICLDAVTGEEKYQERTTSGRFRASPVSVAGHILVTNRDKGTVTVVKAGPKFEKVAENTLPDILAASPAISGPRVYLRGVKSLWCVGEVTR